MFEGFFGRSERKAQAATPPTPRPVREKGYAHDGANWWQLSDEETTPELAWPLSIDVFDKMRRQDSQVGSVLRAVQTPIVRTQWSLDANGIDEDVATFVASNLGLPIKDADPVEPQPAGPRGRGRFSFDEHLRLALLCLPFGHSYFEQVYFAPDETSPYFRLRKLGPRLPRTISKINVARDGGLVSIEQYGPALGGQGAVLPVNRLVAYVLDREGGNWLGRSLLRTGYKNWLLKDRALRTWSIHVDRNGAGVWTYTGAERETNLDAGEDLATSVRSGETAGGAIAYGAKLEGKGVQGDTPDIDKFVRYQDEAIARSALGHFLNLGTQGGGQVGSYNYGSVLADTFNLGLDAIAQMVADTFTSHVIEDLVDINFGPTVPAPRLVFDEVGTRMTELDRIREMTGLTSDADLVKFLRTLPAKEA